MKLDELRFPALDIAQGIVLPRTSPEFVVKPLAIKNGIFRDMWIVDADHRAYHVTGCTVVAEPFWRRPRTPFGRGVRVREVEAEALGVVSIEEVRRRVCAALASTLFEEPDDHVAAIAAQVESCRTVTEIARVLG